MATGLLALPWHPSEEKMHSLLNPRDLDLDNPTSPALTAHAASQLQSSPLLAVGMLDSQGRPWTSLWGGDAGFAVPVGGGMVGVRVAVDGNSDPVVAALSEGQAQGQAKMLSALAIDPDARRRVKLFGRVVAGKLASDEAGSEASIQLITRIEQSLGNCPKYINRRKIVPAPIKPDIIDCGASGAELPDEAVELVRRADTFFVSSSHGDDDMDTNHRGGAAGFVRISQTDEGWRIIWPEYSGNRLYQTLGNLAQTPAAGLCVPDFETGDVLYVTGSTRTLVGADARTVIPRSNLAVVLSVAQARLVRHGLGFRGVNGEASPYNPKIRPLASELARKGGVAGTDRGELAVRNTAKLISQTRLTPTISRFTFSMSNPSASAYKPGQWTALDFSDELDEGYSHMRDDDPQSINDDFVRTFTVSSPPPPRNGDLADDSIELTAKRVGVVTGWLGRQNPRSGVEVPIKGFGGEFVISQDEEADSPFVAGGVGITPLLASLPSLDVSRLKVFWTIAAEDVGLVLDTLRRYPTLTYGARVFLTGSNPAERDAAMKEIRTMGANCEARRLEQDDLLVDGLSNRWYVCAGTGLRKTLLEWLKGKDVVYEDFNF